VVPKLFQFIEQLGAMLLYVEELEHFLYYMSFKLGTVAIVEDMMTYIMVCTSQLIIIIIKIS
jgi:hypothetical protein